MADILIESRVTKQLPCNLPLAIRQQELIDGTYIKQELISKE